MSEISLLLVDDELPLLGLLKKYLEREGFSVETAESGAEALAAASTGRFQLVVLDLNLPDMGGEEIMVRLLDRDPQCRVLISSGMPYGIENVPLAVRPRVGALMKPYMPRQLMEAIRGMLPAGKAAAG
jgi:DNA-binding response OmpR family regulator